MPRERLSGTHTHLCRWCLDHRTPATPSAVTVMALLLPEVRDPNRDRRRQRSPRHDFVVSELVPYATEPVQALPFNLKRAAQPRLGCHVSDFQIFQAPDFGLVLTGMGQPPESPMNIEEALPFTFHERKQHGDLRRPETLTGVVARFQYSPQRVGAFSIFNRAVMVDKKPWRHGFFPVRRGDLTESHPQGPAAPPGG